MRPQQHSLKTFLTVDESYQPDSIKIQRMQSSGKVKQFAVNTQQKNSAGIQTKIALAEQLQTYLDIKEKYIEAEREMGNDNQGRIHSVRNGFGWHKFPNGDWHIGCWNKDEMSGAGVYWFKIKDSQYAYLGDFEQNKFHGEGKLVSMIGPTVGDVIYLGELKEGIKNGTGAFFYDNSPEHYYLGNWIRDQRNGYGELVCPAGWYKGDFRNDLMHGEGTLTTFSNNIATEYKGIWVNNELSAGTISYLNENGILIDSYKGDIISGKKEGEGVYQWGSGLKFEGSFKNDQIKGQGALIGRDFKLKGTFDSSDNTPLQVGGSLRSTIQYQNGDVFEGVVLIEKGIMKRSQGVYTFANGDTAVGQFNDLTPGKIEGKYRYTWASGECKQF